MYGGAAVNTVLLTLGRLPKALDLARGFARAGWRVVVAEPFARHLVGASRCVARSYRVTAPAVDRHRYLAELADIVLREDVRLVVPVSEETMHVAFLPPLVGRDVRVFTMPPAVVLALHDKHRFTARAREYGVRVPETVALGDARAAAMAAGGEVVVKPIHSCSGRGVRVLPRGAALPRDEAAIVQRFIPGAVYSTCSLAHAGEVVVTAVYRAVTLSGSVAVAFERVTDQPAIEAWAAQFIKGAGYKGFISFDFVVDAAGQPWGIECNPRTTSGLHFLEPDDLARSVIEPGAPVRFRPERQLQQFWSCLTEMQHAFGDWPRFQANLRQLFRTRDVSWSWRDPMPLLSMPYTAWQIIALARARGVPFGEVATLDVGWVAAPPSGAAGAP